MLDMAFSAVDDQYVFCVDRMMQNVTRKGGILSAELMADGSYQEAWRQAQRCIITAPELSAYHKTALAVYMTWNQTFRNIFDIDTEALGPDASVYMQYFPYKSLHFLLTDAMRILGSNQKGRCLTVYGQRSSEQLRANRGSEVRLGYFSLASTNPRSKFGMTIRTCHGMELPPSSCRLERGNVLVPPFEKFKVVAVKKHTRGNYFYLESTGTHSNLDCAFYRQVHPTLCHCQVPKHNLQPPTQITPRNFTPQAISSTPPSKPPMRHPRARVSNYSPGGPQRLLVFGASQYERFIDRLKSPYTLFSWLKLAVD